jgi:4-carboxymuconolactone decarboxylase
VSDEREIGTDLIGQLNPQLAGLPTRDEGFAGELRELSIDMAFGKIWSREGLSHRERSIFTLGILIALRADKELEYHFPMALRNGLSTEELEELVYHATVYAGFPAAHAAQLVARKVFGE